MSIFVCPIGVYYDDESCIYCNLCIATTKKELEEASAKMGRYLRAQARKRQAASKEAVKGAREGEGAETSGEAAE